MTDPAAQGTIVIEWTRSPEAIDGDFRWTWSVRADPPLADRDVSELLSEIVARI